MARPPYRSINNKSTIRSLITDIIIRPQTLCLFTILTLSSHILPTVSQVILVPPRLHAQQNNSLILISNRDTSANIRLLDHNNVLLEKNVQFVKDKIISYPLWIDGRKRTKDSRTKIEVTFENGYVDEQNVVIHPSGGLTFFQIDKPIYRPEESVRFRVLRLDSHMRALNETVKLTIFNQQNVKLDETVLHTEPPFYIANYSYRFPAISRDGMWSAEVHYGQNFESKESVSFELSNYKLPNFKAKIQTPKYILKSKSKSFVVKINIDYIYDRQLNGTAYLRIGHMKNKDLDLKQTTNMECFIGGTYSHHVTLSDDIRESAKPFHVEAVIRDCATNQVQRFLSDPIVIVKSPFVILTDNTIKYYKNRSPNHIIVKVTDPLGNPMPNVPLDIDIRTRKHSKDIADTVLSENSKPVTDKNGNYISTFKVDHVGVLDVTIGTKMPGLHDSEQRVENFALDEFNPSEKKHVYIVNRRKLDFIAGEYFESLIDTDNKHFSSLFLIVSSKGTVYHHEKLDGSSFRFKITNQMSPNIRVLVLGMDSDSKIASDFVRLNVQQQNCGPTVQLKTPKVISPGQNVKFDVYGQIGDVVGLHAVDEAVFVLMNSDHKSGFKHLEKALKESDLGCGSGSGRTSADIIQNAGFMILSASERNSKVYLTNFCRHSSSKRRSASKRDTFYNVIDDVVVRKVRAVKNDKCCDMGKYKYVKKQSCHAIKTIVAKYYGENCANRSFDCCRGKDREFAASDVRAPSRQLATASAVYKTVTPNTLEDNMKQEEEMPIEGVRLETRTDFRETWLFDLFVLDDHHKTITEPAPHSITSWSLSTLSLSARDGFCYSNDMRVTTFQDFFLEISIPKRLVEFEQTELVVNVYNYLPKDLMIRVKFFRVDGICSNWGRNRYFTNDNGSVSAYSSKRFNLPIYPYKRGNFQIKVTAESGNRYLSNYTDTVIKNLTVVAPGIEKIESIEFDIDPSNKDKRSTKRFNNITVVQMKPSNSEHLTNVSLTNDMIDISNIVPNTVKYILSASGRSFTPTVKTNDEMVKYIRRPYGDGMNNINMMAHNLYAMMYLNHTNELEKKEKIDAINLIKRSLNYQMSYRKDDGSFSIFKGHGSSLQQFTAYNCKVFCQAAPYLGPQIMDPAIIFSTLRFLASKQNTNGSWTEWNPFAQKSNSKVSSDALDPVSLTAYILGALQHCSDYYNSNNFDYGTDPASIFPSEEYREMIDKAEEFIKREYQIQRKKKLEFEDEKQYSPFKLSLLAYALSFRNNSEVSDLLNLTLASSIRNIDTNELFWLGDIERYPFDTAAYVLMTLIKTDGDIKKMSGLFNWISSQKEFEKFNLTIDTTLGLEAMSKYLSFFYTKRQTNNITLESYIHFNARLRKQFYFNQTNADLIRILEVDPGTTDISIVTRGSGVSKVGLQKVFNEYSPSDICLFELKIRIFDYDIRPEIHSQEDLNSDGVFDDSPIDTMAYEELNGRPLQRDNSTSTCCYRAALKRKKRSWPNSDIFKRMWSRFSKNKYLHADSQGPSSPKRLHGKEYTDENSPNKPNFEGFFPELPYLGLTDGGNVKVLNICARHLQDNKVVLTALEVNLWSGYHFIPIDLEAIANRSNVLEFYELFDNKVIFFFSHIPYQKKECVPFRIYEKEKVFNRHPALIQIYEINSKTISCTRLYHHTEPSADTSRVNCTSKAECECRTSKSCPNSNTLSDIKFGQLSADDFNTMQSLFCTYKMAFIGTVVSSNPGLQRQQHSMVVEVEESFFFGDDSERNLRESQELTIILKAECRTHLKSVNSKVLVLHNSFEDMLFDGDSVLFDLIDPTGNDSHYDFIKSFFQQNSRIRKSCK